MFLVQRKVEEQLRIRYVAELASKRGFPWVKSLQGMVHE